MTKSAPFSLTSLAWAKRGAGMQRANITLIVRDSAVHAAGLLQAPLQQAVRAAGGSAALAEAVTVHEGHLNDLVMRDAGHRGDVIVGVSGENRHADEAEELEWGSVDAAPAAWVRTTTARLGHDVVTMWSNELSRALDRAVLR